MSIIFEYLTLFWIITLALFGAGYLLASFSDWRRERKQHDQQGQSKCKT